MSISYPYFSDIVQTTCSIHKFKQSLSKYLFQHVISFKISIVSANFNLYQRHIYYSVTLSGFTITIKDQETKRISFYADLTVICSIAQLPHVKDIDTELREAIPPAPRNNFFSPHVTLCQYLIHLHIILSKLQIFVEKQRNIPYLKIML